jgi:tetratricopeptide (TPR) repeat protein
MRRMAAITAFAVCVMAVTIVLAIAALVSRHRAVVTQHKAVVAQQAAQRRQKQAEGLVNFMLGDLNDKLAQVQRLDIMQSVDDKAMAYFESLPNTDVTPEALAQRAKALEKIGSVRRNTGHLDGSLAAYRASASISSKLAAAASTNVARQVAYSRALAFIGLIQYEQGKLEDAQHDWETAREVLLPSLKRVPHEVSVLEQLTFLDNDLSHVQAANGQLDAAIALSRERLALDERLVGAKPHDTDYWDDMGGAHNELGRLALQRGDLATTVAEYRADDAIQTRLSARNPHDNSQRENMFRVRAILGRTLALVGDIQTAIHDLQQSAEMATQLSQFDSNNTDVKDELALYSSQLARLQRLDGDIPSATVSSARAITLLETLTKEHPDQQSWQNHYATALTERAAELRAIGDIDAARTSAQEALDILAPILAKRPGERDTLLAVMTAKLLLATVTPDTHSAQSLRNQALQTMRAAKSGRDDPRLLALEVEALLDSGRRTEAQSTIARLRASGYRDPAFVAELNQAHIDYRPDDSTAPKDAGDDTSRP